MKTKVLFLCTGNSCRSQMAEVGVDILSQRSKTIEELPVKEFDWVITLCGHAAENCSFFPGKKIHVGFDDPPKMAAGAKTEEEALSYYRKVRDEIKGFILTLPEPLEDESNN